MKKFLSLVLALVMTMSLVTVSAGAKDFTDNSKINYEEAVEVMSTLGVVGGYTDGSFNPSGTLTRGAAAKIICNLILGTTTADALTADAAPYKDVATTNVFAPYIAYCAKEGIISGYADGTFRPANTLTGYAFMKMLLGALGLQADKEGYTGANWSINVAKRALSDKVDLADGLNGEFNGTKAVTRACMPSTP
ncbi:S-layer homology domain-containing protein [uncultured Dysosmobacter sp.]|uniref:S-layer homology domain-containing protein n=1 Tax=uncultured Dysosmobacter sp. TaxID=2591384 RepID=UPI0026715A89|nr:S-layer homology domain-containing protein [uncultured Dysosmobacter sp.]